MKNSGLSIPEVTRRQVLAGAGASALAALAVSALPKDALADQAKMDAWLKELFGDAARADGGVSLKLPEIAENGNTVPVSVDANDDVRMIAIAADGNPNPSVAVLHFTDSSGKINASTRMRLLKTQNIVAVAKTADGKVMATKKAIKVTIGGCGG